MRAPRVARQDGYVMFRWMQGTNVTPPTFTITALVPSTNATSAPGAGT